MLQVTIKKQLGDFCLDVAFETDRQRLGLFGPSGCGKSLTLKCIAGIEKPDEGRIVLNDMVLFDSEKGINLPPQKRQVGLFFQSYALFPNMTLRKNLEIASRATKETLKDQVEEYVRRFSLQGLEDQYPSELSGGQQQRVAIARMLINQPKVLLFDEPLSALDFHLRWKMQQELKEIFEDYQGSILYVTHNASEVTQLTENVAIYAKGHIERIDRKENIFQHPSSLNQANLVGMQNIYPVTSQQGSLYVKDLDLVLDDKNQDSLGKNMLCIPFDAMSVDPVEGSLPIKTTICDQIGGSHFEILILRTAKGAKEIYYPIHPKDRLSIHTHRPLTVYVRPERFLFLEE